MTSTPHISPEAQRLMEWVGDIQLSARLGTPHYANPSELKADIRSLVEQDRALREEIEVVKLDRDDALRREARLKEQLEATRTALRDLLKETEPRDHKWAVQGGTRPGDCVFCRAHVAASTPAKHPTLDDRNPESVVGVPWNEDGYAGEESSPATKPKEESS